MVAERGQRVLDQPGGLFTIAHQNGQAFAQTRQIPLGDAGLVGIGVAALGIDGGENRPGVIGLHEGAWAVINGLAGDGHIVGVHDTVDKADESPLRDQLGLPLYDGRKQSYGGMRRVPNLGVMAGNDMVGQQAQRFDLATRREILEGADADMARRHTRQHAPGNGALPIDPLARGHRRERARCGNAQREHGLADDIFAQHWSKGRTPIAPAGERRHARAFQLDVPTLPGRGQNLSQQDRPTIAKLGIEMTELMPGIGAGDGVSQRREPVAREDFHALGRREHIRVKPQLPRQPHIQFHQTRRGDRRRRHPRVKDGGEPGVAIVEAGKTHSHHTLLKDWPCAQLAATKFVYYF